ncbi:MAG: MerR family transcriptional regulator [Spirosomataceae bacterium]
MSNYSIKDLEQLSGIKAHTLRIWEQRYDMLKPDRTDTNIRTYTDEDLKLVLNIALLKEHGYKISAIAGMSNQAVCQEVLHVSEKKLSSPDQIHALTLAMLDLDEERFEKIISTNTLQVGFEQTMIQVIFPFLNRIGTLWLSNSIGIAQEHFISSLIRQKIIVAIDGQLPVRKEGGKKFLLYLPAGELHEIGLLFANYLIRSRNHKVVYFGQNLPFDELVFAHNVHNPDGIFAVMTTSPSSEDVQAYVYKLGATFPSTTILLTGHQVVGQDIDCPDNVTIITRIQELIQMI